MSRGGAGGSEHPEDLPWNDVPADSDVPQGSGEPDPAEVEGDEGEEFDAASPRIPDPYAKYRPDTLDERLAEEEPELPLRGEAAAEAGGLQSADEGDEDVDFGEDDVIDPVEGEDPAAEEAAIHIRSEDVLN
jgi:hypothetical protein